MGVASPGLALYIARFRTARPKRHAVAVFDARAQAPLNTEGSKMPKMKTKSGAKKRFKMTATGRVKAGVAGKRHRLSSHDADYIRSHRGTKILKKGDESLVKWYMPYNR
jgi:large subunit ribosomal protein L35